MNVNGSTPFTQKVIHFDFKLSIWMRYSVSHYCKSLWKDRDGIMLPSSATHKLLLPSLEAVNIAYGAL